MSALAITVGLPVAPPKMLGRMLAPSRIVDDERAARAFADTNAGTWRDRLEPGERCFLAMASDRRGIPVVAWEYPRDWREPVIEYSRGELAAMRRAKTTTRTAKGDERP